MTSTTKVTITANQTLYAHWSALIVTGGTQGVDYAYNGTTLNILTGKQLTITGSTTTENIRPLSWRSPNQSLSDFVSHH